MGLILVAQLQPLLTAISGSTPARLPRETKMPFSVADLKRSRVLRVHLAPVIDSCGGDICVTAPFLDLGNVAFVIEDIGGGGRASFISHR